jgi:hypothetical protein
MSQPRTVAALGVVVLAVLIGALVLRDKGQKMESSEQADPSADEPVAVNVETHRPAIPSSVGVTMRASAQPPSAKLQDEASLLATLHELGASDPPRSLAVAKEAVQRFPKSPNAPEFQWNVVKSLYNMRRLEEAKDEGRIMLWKYPDSRFTSDVARHLVNPQPNPSDLPQ